MVGTRHEEGQTAGLRFEIWDLNWELVAGSTSCRFQDIGIADF